MINAQQILIRDNSVKNIKLIEYLFLLKPK